MLLPSITSIKAAVTFPGWRLSFFVCGISLFPFHRRGRLARDRRVWSHEASFPRLKVFLRRQSCLKNELNTENKKRQRRTGARSPLRRRCLKTLASIDPFGALVKFVQIFSPFCIDERISRMLSFSTLNECDYPVILSVSEESDLYWSPIKRLKAVL